MTAVVGPEGARGSGSGGIARFLGWTEGGSGDTAFGMCGAEFGARLSCQGGHKKTKVQGRSRE